MLATIEREAYTNSGEQEGASAPTHSHITKMKLLPVRPTVQ